MIITHYHLKIHSMIMLIKVIKDILNKVMIILELLDLLKIILLRIKLGEHMNSMNSKEEEKQYLLLREEIDLYNLFCLLFFTYSFDKIFY